MEKIDCIREKISSRMVGFFILLVSSLVAFAGLLVLPVIGLFFAFPLLCSVSLLLPWPQKVGL